MPTPNSPTVPAAPERASPAAAPLNGEVKGAYGEDQISVLEGLDAVRKRPGMYIGGTGPTGLHHLVFEVVDNSIDEAMAGHAKRIDVTIGADGTCSVEDDGRGIPVGPMKHEDPTLNGRPAVEVVMTRLHAGGKFGQEGSAYKVSGGLHGVGVSCVNALSARLDCEIRRDGKRYAIAFERGRVADPLRTVGDLPADSAARTGTRVVFHPDPDIFPETEFSYHTLAARLRELSYLNPGVEISLTDDRVGPDGETRSETFRAATGLPEYVDHLMAGKSAVSPPVWIRKTEAAQNLSCEVAMQYHDGYNETLIAFANNIRNPDGGTHAQGFKLALTRTINAYARKSGIIRDKDPVPTGDDLREGLIAAVSVKLPDPAFNNQPKERLLNPEVEPFVSQAVSEALEAWLQEHPAEAKRLCLKGIVAAQAREAARKARELTRRKTALDSGSMPHKLRDCKAKGDESELFIVEGESAGGSATQGRNVDTQAILPLKGKILNVEKARLDKVLAFEEIRTLISALRCGIGDEFDAARLRYGKVIIMTDADVDGSHIRTLLLTFFFRQMPELIRRGRVYIAQPPLYLVSRGRSSGRYVLNEKLLHDALTDLGLDHALLVVRSRPGPDGRAAEQRRLQGQEARRAVRLLERLGELAGIAQRRGMRFADLIAACRPDAGRLRAPSFRVAWRGGDAFAWSLQDATDIAARHADATVRELHEARELDRLAADLAVLDLPLSDYATARVESDSGDVAPARFAWVMAGPAAADSDAADAPDPPVDPAADSPADKPASQKADRRVVEAPGLQDILPALHEVGRRGLEIKRFKGLGEMDAEQLWETTMDPARRTLLRVAMDQASEADGLFATLMGEQVEPRRRFIEEHALEVRNLDV